jgi:hypothetical protein
MKHLKLFEELNPETYASAASKLKEKHERRSKELFDYSVKMSKGTIDRIDPNDYEIYFDCDDFEIDGTYKIIECQEDEDGDVTVTLTNGPSTIKISTKFEANELWIRPISPDEDEYWPGFLFQNRKDTNNFRKFIISDTGKCPISVNDMYQD